MSDEDRIRELERRVTILEERLAAGTRPRPSRRRTGTLKELADGPAARRLVEFVAGEGALARIGIGLLLLGVLWLVRYSIDEGWLGEWARVLLAAGAGLVLLGLGKKLADTGRVLSQILFGGGIGALYMAAFSAHAFYSLVSFPAAMALMTGVTALCFVLGLREGSFTLASIAAIGGLSTPFLLNSGEGSIAALGAYILVIQIAVAGVYYLRAWGSTVLVAGVMTMFALILANIRVEAEAPFVDKLWLELAIISAWVTYAVLPALRPGESSAAASRFLTQAMAGLAPVVAWLMTVVALDLERWPATGLAVVFSAGYAVALVRSTRGAYWNNITMFAAFALAGTAIFMATDGRGAGLLPALALGAYYLASRDDEEGRFAPGDWIGALLVLLGVFALSTRLLSPTGASYQWPNAIYDGIGIVSVVACAHWSKFPRLLRVASWLLALLYLQREFGHIGELTEIGPAAVSVAWAAAALGLLGAGRRVHSDAYRYAGMVTIGLVVFRLVLFDLEALDPVWKILIPIAIGAAMLVMSYLFPSWWRGEESPPD